MATEASLNYFTCTLGEAAELMGNIPRDFETITEFIDVQAQIHRDKPAVGFPFPASENNETRGYNLYSFNGLKRGSIVVAKSLTHLVVENKIIDEQKCVGLICPSSEDFLFVWLGLMRAGFSVLLIAPQCPPDAIAHLCKSCEVSTLFYDEVYHGLAISATKNSSSLAACIFPWQTWKTPLLSIIQDDSLNLKHTVVHKATSQSVAYILHTSGTSSGLPKPIPQTHHAAVGVLPLLNGAFTATFTTTPLYHGGIADCFRAWTSNAMIWLFPGGRMPITARNIVSSLSITHEVALESPFPQVKYFSSVPYVLQMLAEDEEGLEWLQKMDIVGVGGAALPESVGNDLISKDVNLTSRFGSAECGFLLSSHRDYSTDRDWQYLRAPANGAFLKFEKQDDGSGLSELVVLKGWPHMAKTNREDGSFATSDLFEPHPEIQGAWKYHSRSDSQITLITGKKFDPAPMEDAIVAAAADVRDCFIFGNGRQVPGALLFLKENVDMTTRVEVVKRIWNAVEGVNKNSQDHTRISKDMFFLKRDGNLEKSSKGTVLRSAAEKTFASVIETAYTRTISISNSGNKSTVEIVRAIVIGLLGTTRLSFGDQDDFYQHGVDSASCMRIRNQLEKHFHVEGKPLPWNIVYDCGSIDRLSEYLASRSAEEMEKELGSKEMLELVHRYSIVRESTPIPYDAPISISESRVEGEVVLLTGATGALGSHILSQLLANPSVTRIYCLLRANRPRDIEEASVQMKRVLEAMKKRFLLPTSQQPFEKLQFLPANVEEENLGCSAKSYEELRNNVSTIIHAAWPVNFSLPLRAFEPSLRGLRNLLQLSHLSPRETKFVFCSSTAAILGPNHPSVIPEAVSSSPDDADTLGYSKSKWVAEMICSEIAYPLVRRLKVRIMRIGQLTGDTEHGVWNMSEAYPLMLSTVRELGCLPKLQDALSWLPLDVAAKVICEIAFAFDETSLDSMRWAPCEVYHVVNNDFSTSFMDLLGWMKKIRKEPFEIVEPAVWLEKLE